MIPRHRDILKSRLEDAYLNGCSHITMNELYFWFGTLKIAAATYREIDNLWQRLISKKEEEESKIEYPGKLKMIKGKGGIFIFGEDTAKLVCEDAIYPSDL